MLDRFENFTFVLSEITHYWNKIAAAEMEQYGLKGPYVLYLLALYRHPAGITAARLAELCGRDKADVSRALALMEQNELITRHGIHRNAYRAPVLLTANGKKAAEHLKSRAEAAVQAGSAGITDEERTILYNVLATIAANLREVTERGL